MRRILVVGAGFSGSVIAEQLARSGNFQIDVIDKRNHLAGNCYTERDAETGIMVHTYGPHIFNTDKIDIWNYLNQFDEIIPYVNRVKTVFREQVYSMPINLHTINQFFGKAFNPEQAKDFIVGQSDKTIKNPANFEEQALKLIGKELYKAFFYGYTKKQWGCEPSELPASILKRLPIRFNYNDNYYANTFQGIPKHGYTAVFEKMLDFNNINIHLNTTFDCGFDVSPYEHIFYTGPIDKFFNYKYGRLGYRTVYFERHQADGDFLGNAVMNYADAEIPFTRIHEHKHFAPWEQHEKTVYFSEFSKETGKDDLPYYPKCLDEDLKILELYKRDVLQLKNFTFLGRLASYRYMDMQHVIENALIVSRKFIAKHSL